MAYFLDNDGDGHWYVIPKELSGEWRQWLEDMVLYCEDQSNYVREPELPEGIESLGNQGYRSLTFPDYTIELF